MSAREQGGGPKSSIQTLELYTEKSRDGMITKSLTIPGPWGRVDLILRPAPLGGGGGGGGGSDTIPRPDPVEGRV